jgi:hypothetical protein
MRIILLLAVILLTNSCGIQGKLVRPSDIPAYEKQQEKKNGSLPL